MRNEYPDRERAVSELSAVWPQRFEWRYVWLFSVCGLSSLGALAAAWAAPTGVAAIGLSGGAVAMGCLAWLCSRSAGIRWISSSRKVHRCSSLTFGDGIRIGPANLVLSVLISVLLGMGVYCAAVVAAFWLDLETLLPEFRGGSHVVFAAACGAVLLVVAMLLSLFRPSVGIELYAEAVVRTVARRSFLRIGDDVVLPWSAITEIADDVVLNTVGLWVTRDPLIRLCTNGEVPSRGRLGWDTDDYIQLPVSWMAAEPNTMLAVLREMLFSENRRRVLLAGEPTSIFAPPPLRYRFRSSAAG